MSESDEVRIPKDPAARAALAKMAGLTDEETAALDQWCYDEEMKRRAEIERRVALFWKYLRSGMTVQEAWTAACGEVK